MEHVGLITFKGDKLTLLGPELETGREAPDFTVYNEELQPVRLTDFSGQPVIISVVPSLDTPVCELQTRRFNSEAAKLKIKTLTISMDLPFAQRRFCDSFKIDNVITLSDYKDRDFGFKYGLYIKELGLLARAVLIVDANRRIVYKQLVKEVTSEPDYNEVLNAVGKLIS